LISFLDGEPSLPEKNQKQHFKMKYFILSELSILCLIFNVGFKEPFVAFKCISLSNFANLPNETNPSFAVLILSNNELSD
jgi:hypothetical protein